MRMQFSTLMMAAVALAAALSTQAAMAASHVVQIPFNFVAAGQQCPAGEYAVRDDNRGATVTLSGAQQNFLWMLFPGETGRDQHRVVLTFDVAGQQYQLRTVQFGNMRTARIDKNVKEAIPAGQQVEIGGE